MIRSVVAWGIEVGWQDCEKGRRLMARLQYEALRKWTGAIAGARQSVGREIAAVEEVSMFAEAACGRFLAWAMSDLHRVGVTEAGDYEGTLSLWGPCWRGTIDECDLRVEGGASKSE